MNRFDKVELELLSIGKEEKTKQRYLDSLERQRIALDKISDDAELDQIDEEIASLKMKRKEKIKELKTKSTVLLKDYRHGFVLETKNCDKVPDFDDRMMRYYDEDGMLFDERPLLPNENQYAIQQRVVGEK